MYFSYVSALRLRQLFNESQYPELIRKKRLKREVVRSRRLKASDRQKKSLPRGTKSEIIIYHDPANKELYVKVHRYVKFYGILGASGKPDPKAILLDGIMYLLEGPET